MACDLVRIRPTGPVRDRFRAKLDKVKIRLEADAPSMKKAGAELIAHYLARTGSLPARSGPASTPTHSDDCACSTPTMATALAEAAVREARDFPVKSTC